MPTLVGGSSPSRRQCQDSVLGLVCVLPPSLPPLTLAPCLMRISITSMWALPAAQWRGVSESLFCASTSAPFLISSSTVDFRLGASDTTAQCCTGAGRGRGGGGEGEGLRQTQCSTACHFIKTRLPTELLAMGRRHDSRQLALPVFL